MKNLIKILFLFAFITPFATVSADTHDDATMEAIEHSNSERYEHEIELPDGSSDDADHDREHAADDNHEKDDMDDKDDSADDKDSAMDDKDDSVDDKDSAMEDAEHSSEDNQM